ncbi:hypothetical protein HJC23_001043 [Cyclotella cryptica]|uniref:Vacuolar-sorting protein SNF8 n=1 Tax=Cyclotella cryptica TaxID=29204 RepID=A0ABD3QJ35_9STRA|eukprot:CCRYP_004978-RA/>CCRYP_004978-RA protein AED:0.07 eAED:0.07 QI:130/1/1/1/0.5/0.44/9/3530/253
MAHRRRGVGVGRAGAAAYTKKAEELKAIDLASAMETVEKLEIKLAEFAKKHKHDIQHDPAFRAKFLEMCAPLGVDPLSAEKGFWGSMLGIGEFYYELSVKVAEVCIASRSRNGGIIRVKEVKDILTARGTKFKFADSNSKSTYTEEDIITSVKKLSKLGSGFRTIKVGRSTMIVSVPEELDDDHMQVMDIAENDNFGPYGMVTIGHLKMALSWDDERAKRALDLLLGRGMAWLDDFRGVTSYWFPSLWKQRSS